MMESLVLRNIFLNKQEISLFRYWATACNHIRDHVLSAPESEAWALLFNYHHNSQIKPKENFTVTFLKDMYASNGCSCQGLYDEYCWHIHKSLEDAYQLKWVAIKADLVITMGLSGIICILERNVLKTAFIGGAGIPFEVSHKNIKPYIRRRHNNHAFSKKVLDEKDILNEIHQNFKKSVKFVRTLHVRTVNYEGEIECSDYARLKEVLPPLSELKFEAWQNNWLKLESDEKNDR